MGPELGLVCLGRSLSGVEVKLAFINPQFWFSRGRAGHYNSKSYLKNSDFLLGVRDVF